MHLLPGGGGKKSSRAWASGKQYTQVSGYLSATALPGPRSGWKEGVCLQRLGVHPQLRIPPLALYKEELESVNKHG